MAKIFEHSEDADVKQLALFETPPTNISVEERYYINFHPVSGITSTSDADGAVPADDTVFPINNLYNQCGVKLKFLFVEN